MKKFIQSINLNGVTYGTVTRLIMMLITAVVYVLSLFDIEIPVVGESTVASIVIAVFGIISFLQSYWKNNSWTQAAQDADAVMEECKNN